MGSYIGNTYGCLGLVSPTTMMLLVASTYNNPYNRSRSISRSLVISGNPILSPQSPAGRKFKLLKALNHKP